MPEPPTPGRRSGLPDPQITPEAAVVVPGVIAVAVAITSWELNVPDDVMFTRQLTLLVSVDARTSSSQPARSETAGLAKSTGTTDNTLSIRVSADGQPPMRCIRLTGMLGLIRLGTNSATGSTPTDCTSWGAL